MLQICTPTVLFSVPVRMILSLLLFLLIVSDTLVLIYGEGWDGTSHQLVRRVIKLNSSLDQLNDSLQKQVLTVNHNGPPVAASVDQIDHFSQDLHTNQAVYLKEGYHEVHLSKLRLIKFSEQVAKILGRVVEYHLKKCHLVLATSSCQSQLFKSTLRSVLHWLITRVLQYIFYKSNKA